MKKTRVKIVMTAAVAAGILFLLWQKNRRQATESRPVSSDYVAAIKIHGQRTVFLEGEETQIPITLENQGRSVWSSSGKHPVLLHCEIRNRQGEVLKRNRNQFPLPRKLRPGESLGMAVPFTAPLRKGRYGYGLKLLKKDVTWFHNPEPEKSRALFKVKERRWPGEPPIPHLGYGRYTKIKCSEPVLEDIFKMMRLNLSRNEMSFAGKTGKVFGFYAGSGYPQIWLRDANSLLPLIIYFYDPLPLTSWLEEHLAYQKKDGSLQDTIDESGRTEKNTTETDQETSAVQSGYRISRILGSAWLRKKIDGEEIIHRLEKSLIYPLTQRFDARFKLLTGAHTADWGDVDVVDPDEKAVDVDGRTHWTVDIYDQSMFYQACLHLAAMQDSTGQRAKADTWRTRAESIRENTNRWLWQEDKGYFRVHRHTDGWTHDFEEDGIFPMGGNAQAVLAGLADEIQSQRIIQTALKRQKAYKISTISGTLIPPYPAHFFKHAMMDQPYEYQNGGQWDWFGGRLLAAMFEHGFVREARKKLTEIGRKNIANGGFFEWDSREGVGQGSSRFLGSTGSLGQALFEGYFGIRMGKGFLDLEPKIGRDSAEIHVYQPATDTFVAYRYNFDPGGNELVLEYNSNFTGRGSLKIWDVWSVPEIGQTENKTAIEVFLDGKKVPYKTEKRNLDRFIVMGTDFRNHTVRIAPSK